MIFEKNDDEKNYEILHKIIESFNSKSKTANQLLIFYVTIQVFCLLKLQIKNQEIELMFGLGKTSIETFKLISIVSISIISIVFASVMIQMLKTKMEIYELAEIVPRIKNEKINYVEYVDSSTNSLYLDISSFISNFLLKTKKLTNTLVTSIYLMLKVIFFVFLLTSSFNIFKLSYSSLNKEAMILTVMWIFSSVFLFLYVLMEIKLIELRIRKLGVLHS